MRSIQQMTRTLQVAFACTLALLGGCAQVPLGAPGPSMDNIQRARASGISPVALGTFSLAEGKSASMDQRVTARTSTYYSPYDSSFAKYLKENLAVELRAAGLLDPGSKIVIEGRLTDSQLDAATGQGSGVVAARFVVTRSGVKVFDKELRARATWDSPFVGAYALPAAFNGYTSLYRQLVATLLDDPEFRAAAKN